MKQRISKSLYLYIILLSSFGISAHNLIPNGDFESVGFDAAFRSDYTLVASNSGLRNYAIVSKPSTINSNFGNTYTDHSASGNKMMVVDGTTSGANNNKVWEALTNIGGGVGIPVFSDATYKFSYWIQFISSTNTDTNWADMSLTEPLSVVYSISNVTCPAATNGTIFGYGKGGTPPYVNFSLSGPTVVPNNTNGFFTGLASGTYSLTITDNVGVSVTQNGIVVSTPPDLTIGASSTSICAGVATTITASGGGSTYNWSDNPLAATFTTAASQTVSPTQTTVYTVSSPVSRLDNLIYNGDFFLGNVGFTSDYTYYNPNNPTNAQKAYGVVNIANTWETSFEAATDHTNLTSPGTGKMMVVNGSTSNGGNDKVWCQTVPVVPGETYSLKYWIQSLVLVNPLPAKIEVSINNVSQGPAIIAPSAPSSWVQQSYTWTAGAGVTTAKICFYDKEVQLNGNDFALDDITFARTNSCTLQKTITVNVTPGPALSASVTAQPSCTDPTGTITVSAPLGGNFEYSINGSNYQSNPIFAALADNTYPVTVRNTTTSCVSTPVNLTINTAADVIEPASPGFPDLAFCYQNSTPPLPTTSPNGISGTWLPNTIDNEVSASYEFTPDPGECALKQTINVTINQYTLIAIDSVITNYFGDNQVVTVLATDSGNYLYQLDYGPLQQSNVFQNVSVGTHVIKVVDDNGCSSPLTRDIFVVNYPKLFTPNADNYNDTWNISGLQGDAKIFIFDRNGKLIKQISPSGQGWDGTYKGAPLPSDDYWFLIEFTENFQSKKYKAHFSLKR